MTDFDPDWPHGHMHSITGKPMRLVCRDAKGQWTFLWLLESANGEDEFCEWSRRDGSLAFKPGRAINAPAPKRKFEVWVNFYPHESPRVHPTREVADIYATKNRIACLRVTGKEGDGL